MVPLERQCWGNSQYSKRECLEITGVAIDPSNNEHCHWLKSNGPKKVIIKFARRKDANIIRKNKNKLKGMNLCSIGINNPVFINDSLCSYYKIYGEYAKNVGLVNIFMLFGCLMTH